MEYWRCGKVDQSKKRNRPRSEIEGREVLPGTRYSTVVSYGAIKFQYLIHAPE